MTDNRATTEAKQLINQRVVEVWRTYNLSPRDMERILISIAGDIATHEEEPDFYVRIVDSFGNPFIVNGSGEYWKTK